MIRACIKYACIKYACIKCAILFYVSPDTLIGCYRRIIFIFRALSALMPGVVENAMHKVNVKDIKAQYERQMRNFLSRVSKIDGIVYIRRSESLKR